MLFPPSRIFLGVIQETKFFLLVLLFLLIGFGLGFHMLSGGDVSHHRFGNLQRMLPDIMMMMLGEMGDTGDFLGLADPLDEDYSIFGKYPTHSPFPRPFPRRARTCTLSCVFKCEFCCWLPSRPCRAARAMLHLNATSLEGLKVCPNTEAPSHHPPLTLCAPSPPLFDSTFIALFHLFCPGNKMEFGVGAVLLMMFIIIFPIMLINMLVALLSDIFDRVQENMEEEWRAEQCRIIVEMEYYALRDRRGRLKGLGKSQRNKIFPSWIHLLTPDHMKNARQWRGRLNAISSRVGLEFKNVIGSIGISEMRVQLLNVSKEISSLQRSVERIQQQNGRTEENTEDGDGKQHADGNHSSRGAQDRGDDGWGGGWGGGGGGGGGRSPGRGPGRRP